MRLKTVEIDNYAPFDKVSLDLKDTSYIVVGENQTDAQVSSNGAGKSCLIQAIVWCIFGEVIRPGLLTDDIIGSQGKHVRVVLEFEKDGRQWKIDRARHYPGRRNNEPIVTIDGEDVTQHKGNDAFIQSQLGFNFAVFMFAGYSDAENPPFCRLSPAVMLKSFLDILELEKLDAVESDLKTVVKALDQEKSANEREQFRHKETIRSCDSLINQLLERLREFDLVKAEEIKSIKQEIKEAQELVDETAEVISKLPIYYQVQKEIETRLANYSGKVARAKQLKSELSELTKKVDRRLSEKQRLLKEADVLKEQYSNLAENESCICGYCGSKFSADSATDKIHELLATMEDLALKIVNVEQTLHNSELESDKLSKELSTLEEQLEGHASALVDKSEIAHEIAQIERYAKESAKRTKVQIPALENKLSKLEDSSSDFEETLLSQKKAERQSQVLQLDSVEIKHATLCSRRDFAVSLQSRTKDLKKLVLNDFIIGLESEINHNLEKMLTDIRASIDFSEKKLLLFFTNSSKDGAFVPYSYFSRGERSKIDKACALALNDIFGVGIYMDDEGLSGIDWEAAKGLMEFLTNSEDHTRLLVFHNDRVQSHLESVGVSTLKVIKTEGISHAKVHQSKTMEPR